MRRLLMVALVVLALSGLAACGSSGKKTGSPTTTTIAGVSVPGSTTLPSTSTSTSVLLPTTSLPSCQALAVPARPVSSPAPAKPVVLTKVDELGDNCVDHVVFSFRSKYPNPPGYTVSYVSPPFVNDAQGAPLPVKGNAFILVRLSPAYGYDVYGDGGAIYKGPDRITPASTRYVTEIVKRGDFEGVVSWIIGLNAKRGFSVQATGKPQTQLVVTVG
jgi:hypothetical protein